MVLATTYSVPVAECAIRAVELKKIKTDDPNDSGLMSYDPAFLNTASCRSAITYIDGDKGILRYRGYPIEELATRFRFRRGLRHCRGRTTRSRPSSPTTRLSPGTGGTR